MDWSDQRQRKAALAAGEKKRLDRDYRERYSHMPGEPGRLPEEVDALREQAAKTAAICGDCFKPLAPQASVTMVARIVLDDRWLGDRSLLVPVCVSCWLADLKHRAVVCWPARHRSQRHVSENHLAVEYVRIRCEGCGRPMRVHRLAKQGERACSERCLHRAYHRAYYKRHRKIVQRPRRCAVCRVMFIPTRSDQVTHSAACRQALYRLRHRRALPSSRC